MSATENDREILARTVWGEARGEGLEGQIAVAWSIRNRVEMDLHNDDKPDWWGEGYADVCQKAWQFSCWNTNDPNYPFVSGAQPMPLREFVRARLTANRVIDGKLPDPTGGATHYFATTMPKAPAWAAQARQTMVLGHHVFFRDVP